MSKLLLFALLIFLTIVTTIWADDLIYDKPYGGKKVGRYKDGTVYDSPYGGEAMGRSDSEDGAGYWLLEEEGE